MTIKDLPPEQCPVLHFCHFCVMAVQISLPRWIGQGKRHPYPSLVYALSPAPSVSLSPFIPHHHPPLPRSPLPSWLHDDRDRDSMSRFGSSATQSGGSGASRMVPRLVTESSSRLHLEEFPLGDETGLPLIPCPDCGLARVIERRSGKEMTKNYLRVLFKCPRNGVSI